MDITTERQKLVTLLARKPEMVSVEQVNDIIAGCDALLARLKEADKDWHDEETVEAALLQLYEDVTGIINKADTLHVASKAFMKDRGLFVGENGKITVWKNGRTLSPSISSPSDTRNLRPVPHFRAAIQHVRSHADVLLCPERDRYKPDETFEYARLYDPEGIIEKQSKIRLCDAFVESCEEFLAEKHDFPAKAPAEFYLPIFLRFGEAAHLVRQAVSLEIADTSAFQLEGGQRFKNLRITSHAHADRELVIVADIRLNIFTLFNDETHCRTPVETAKKLAENKLQELRVLNI